MIQSNTNLSDDAHSPISQKIALSVHKDKPQTNKPWLYSGGYSATQFENLWDLSAAICRSVYSPILWADGRRRSENFEQCDVCALDFDDGKLTLADAEAWLRKNRLCGILGTTKSHQTAKRSGDRHLPACDRFRIIMPFQARITNRQVYEATMKHYMGLLPCDPSCKDAARYFFPCREIVKIVEGNALVPVHPRPKKISLISGHSPNFSAFRAANMIPRHIAQLLRDGWPEGGRHSKCYHIAAALTQRGYDEDEIIRLILKSPLAAIGNQDVIRAVHNAAVKVKQN